MQGRTRKRDCLGSLRKLRARLNKVPTEIRSVLLSLGRLSTADREAERVAALGSRTESDLLPDKDDECDQSAVKFSANLAALRSIQLVQACLQDIQTLQTQANKSWAQMFRPPAKNPARQPAKSPARQAAGRKKAKSLATWHDAVSRARASLDLPGCVLPKRGSALHTKATEYLSKSRRQVYDGGP